ncbi:MAG: cytochrome c biogenesis protein ResB [Verrucomicrobia bacterium]|nr:cytochrome c biogenesis protein ResB [Verrucomicrobiota bacterium]
MSSSRARRQLVDIGDRIVRFLASYAFAVVILSFLLVLTFLGTLEQVDHGLYAVQKKYFDSLFLIHQLFGRLPILLPGVYLLMSLLFVNLTVGGIIRVRRSWRHPGTLIMHGGILVLLLGGFVAHHFSTSGNMQLYEGRSSNEFTSYYDWVIELRQRDEQGGTTVYSIGPNTLKHLRPGEERNFHHDALPFDVNVAGYAINSRPRPSGGNSAFVSVDGFYLQSLPRDPEAEANVAGAYVTLTEKGGGASHEAIVWGFEFAPFVTTIGGTSWSVGMVRQKWELPFTILLDDFTVEMHPNTGIAKVFLSDVTKIEGRSQEKIKITMNEPFRYKGYTLFQSTWGPSNAEPGTPLYSGFSVVSNPADHWPLVSCIIVAIGMLIHFLQRLFVHLRTREL